MKATLDVLNERVRLLKLRAVRERRKPKDAATDELRARLAAGRTPEGKTGAHLAVALGLVCAFVVLTSHHNAATEPATRSGPPAIEPDAEAQEHLERLSHASRNDPAFYTEVVALRRLTRERPDGVKYVLRQAILKSANDPDDRVLKDVTWQLQIPDVLLLTALLQCHNSSDERLRAFARKRLELDARPDQRTPVDELTASDPLVSALLMYIHERRHDPPWELVRLLYDKAPSAAAVKFARTWLAGGDDANRRAVLWTDHLARDAVWKAEMSGLKKEELREVVSRLSELAEADPWWVRLYVAEMLRRHPMFLTPDVAKRLRADPSGIVAEALDRKYFGGLSEEEWRDRRRGF